MLRICWWKLNTTHWPLCILYMWLFKWCMSRETISWHNGRECDIQRFECGTLSHMSRETISRQKYQPLCLGIVSRDIIDWLDITDSICRENVCCLKVESDHLLISLPIPAMFKLWPWLTRQCGSALAKILTMLPIGYTVRNQPYPSKRPFTRVRSKDVGSSA